MVLAVRILKCAVLAASADHAVDSDVEAEQVVSGAAREVDEVPAGFDARMRENPDRASLRQRERAVVIRHGDGSEAGGCLVALEVLGVVDALRGQVVDAVDVAEGRGVGQRCDGRVGGLGGVCHA